jgi:hypothetical protein
MKFAIVAIVGMFASALALRENCGDKLCHNDERCCKNGAKTICQQSKCSELTPKGQWKKIKNASGAKVGGVRRRF